MRVATLRLTLFLPGVHTLKEKRRIVKSLKERLQARFNVSVAETDHQDLWQKAELGVAMVSGDGEDLRGRSAAVLDFVRRAPDAALSSHEEEFL